MPDLPQVSASNLKILKLSAKRSAVEPRLTRAEIVVINRQFNAELRLDRAVARILSRVLDFLRPSGRLDQDVASGPQSRPTALSLRGRKQQHAQSWSATPTEWVFY